MPVIEYAIIFAKLHVRMLHIQNEIKKFLFFLFLDKLSGTHQPGMEWHLMMQWIWNLLCMRKL